MRVLVLGEEREYTGREMRPLWAYERFGIEEDSVVCFLGACDVGAGYMLDMEDKKAEARIYSPKMLHFVVEHFDLPIMKLIYLRQRLLAAIAREAVEEASGKSTGREGDDLYYGNRKLSVSIASTSPVSSKVHLGINVTSVEYASLSDMELSGEVEGLGKEIAEAYAGEIEGIERDIRKTRPLGWYSEG